MSHRCDRWTFESKATMCSSVIKHSYQVPFEAPATRKFQSGQFDALYQKSCWSVCWYPFDILVIRMILQDLPEKQPCRENQLWTLVALKGKVTFLSTSSRKKRAVIVFGAVCKTNFPRFASSQELAVNGAGALIPQHLRHLRGNVCSSHRKSKDSSRVKGKSSSYLRSSRVSLGAYLKKEKKSGQVVDASLRFKNKAVRMVRDGPGWSIPSWAMPRPEIQKAGQTAHSPRVRFEIPHVIQMFKLLPIYNAKFRNDIHMNKLHSQKIYVSLNLHWEVSRWVALFPRCWSCSILKREI